MLLINYCFLSCIGNKLEGALKFRKSHNWALLRLTRSEYSQNILSFIGIGGTVKIHNTSGLHGTSRFIRLDSNFRNTWTNFFKFQLLKIYYLWISVFYSVYLKHFSTICQFKSLKIFNYAFKSSNSGVSDTYINLCFVQTTQKALWIFVFSYFLRFFMKECCQCNNNHYILTMLLILRWLMTLRVSFHIHGISVTLTDFKINKRLNRLISEIWASTS